jgi:hypothetical protein
MEYLSPVLHFDGWRKAELPGQERSANQDKVRRTPGGAVNIGQWVSVSANADIIWETVRRLHVDSGLLLTLWQSAEYLEEEIPAGKSTEAAREVIEGVQAGPIYKLVSQLKPLLAQLEDDFNKVSPEQWKMVSQVLDRLMLASEWSPRRGGFLSLHALPDLFLRTSVRCARAF